MGLTSMKARTFYWVSQLGMLLGTAAYVNAGTELARITSLQGILSPGLLLAFAFLGLLPLASRKVIDAFRARRVYARWAGQKPARFDRNVVVIGAGSAGLVTSYIAAAVRAKVTLVERHRMGGDCLYTGCVPSKALIRSAKLLNHIARAKEFGIAAASARWDFAEVMERVQRVITTIEPHDSVAALHEPRRGLRAGHRPDRHALGGGDRARGRHEPAAHHAQHRDRHRRAALRAADPGTCRGEPAHLGHDLGSPQAAPAPRRAGRRPDRLRAGPVLRALRLAR